MKETFHGGIQILSEMVINKGFIKLILLLCATDILKALSYC